MRTSQHGTQNIKTHNRTTQKTKKMSNTDPHQKTIYIHIISFLIVVCTIFVTRFWRDNLTISFWWTLMCAEISHWKKCCANIEIGGKEFTVQYLPITTDVVSLNLAQGDVYNILWLSLSLTNLRQVSGFLRVLWFLLAIKLTATI
jgi:hypothetical protein